MIRQRKKVSPNKFTSNEVSQCISELPLCSVEKSLPALNDLFHRFLGVDVAPALRVDVLVRMEQPISEIVEMLRVRLTEGRFPLSASLERDVNAAIELQMAQISNYQSLIGKLGRKKGRLMLEQALQVSLRLQRFCLKAYKLVPTNFWSHAYKVIGAAEKAGIRLNEETTGKYPEIISLIKRVILLHLAAPHRLYQNELLLAEKLVDQFADLMILSREPCSSENPAGLFFLHQGSDHPPRHVVFLDNEGSDLVLINTGPVMQALSERVPELAQQREYKMLGLSKQTLNKVVGRWWRASRRNSQRVVASEVQSTSMLLGAETAIRCLRLAQAGPEFLKNFSFIEAEVVNRSASGYCLRWRLHKNQQLRVGELVAFPAGKGDDLEIGIIRWVLNTDSSVVNMGVEMLSPVAEIRRMRSGAQADEEFVLYLPEHSGLKKDASLICLSSVHRVGGWVNLVDQQGREFAATLERVLDAGLGFSHFRILLPVAPPG